MQIERNGCCHGRYCEQPFHSTTEVQQIMRNFLCCNSTADRKGNEIGINMIIYIDPPRCLSVCDMRSALAARLLRYSLRWWSVGLCKLTVCVRSWSICRQLVTQIFNWVQGTSRNLAQKVADWRVIITSGRWLELVGGFSNKWFVGWWLHMTPSLSNRLPYLGIDILGVEIFGDAAFIWSIWHKAVAVNEWGGR